jgi:rhodanese-related sulfurtransferase
MFGLIKKLFGFGGNVDLGALIREGAVVIDVRSKAEYASGHVKGSINIPLEQVSANITKLKKHNHIITCCRSGARSGMAKRTLVANGFNNVTNGGSWQSVNQHV